jgi:hypothetical protein
MERWNKMNMYRELRKKQEQELNNFPMFFAFNNEQFIKGMHKLGLSSKDTDKIISLNSGGYIRKTDKQAYNDMFKRFEAEHNKAMLDNKYLYDAFSYELANHEYGVTYDITDTLHALDLTVEQVNADDRLKNAFYEAKEDYLENYIW